MVAVGCWPHAGVRLSVPPEAQHAGNLELVGPSWIMPSKDDVLDRNRS